MRLVAGQKYVKGPHGEIMPYTPDMAKITGCVVFTQDKDYADSLQLVENENMQRFRGRRTVEVEQKTFGESLGVEKEIVVSKPQVQVKKPIKPVPTQKKVFEAEFDLREEMASDMKAEVSDDPPELN